MAGKAVKCPGCQAVLKVPAVGATAPAPVPRAPTQPAPQQPAAPQVGGGLGDLFDEEGFSKQVGRVCSNCAADLSENAVLCTKCGFHAEEGVVLQAHETAGVDVSHGTLALRKAAKDMRKAKAMQQKLEQGPGMPWWAHSLVLFMIVLSIVVGVIVVNASRRVDEDVTFNPIALFLQLSGSAFSVVSFGALAMIAAHAFKQAWWKAPLVLLVAPFTLYYVFTNLKPTWKLLFVCIVTGVIGGVMVGLGIQMASQ